MTTSKFIQRLQGEPTLVLDGATGTNLQRRGLERGAPGEKWVLEHPEEILRLHGEFIAAGADILLTCSFGATRVRLAHIGLADQVTLVNQRAVELALEAVKGSQVLVAGSMGPLGELLEPNGRLSADTARAAYTEQALALSQAGVDLLLVETQYDLAEAAIAIQAAHASSSLPVVCSFSFDRGTRSMMGVRPAQAAQELTALGVTAIGINCGRSLDENLEVLEEMRQNTDLPLWFKPNAGMPTLDANGTPVYSVTPEQMGAMVPGWIQAGAKLVGGCCGTSPDHLAAIALNARRN
jgi:5-methyltetrahydrofolate--homocysteine methyltransferase